METKDRFFLFPRITQPQYGLGGISGALVPATATGPGYFYNITAAGTSQSITWAVGDWAVYNGVSGSWSKVPFNSTLTIALESSINAKDNARATAQGLILDGLAVAPLASAIPAFGTADFSVEVWVNITAGLGNSALIGASNGGFEITTNSSTTLLPTAYKKNTGITLAATTAAPTGRVVHLIYVRASGVGTWYMNGAAAGTGADTTDYTGTITHFGAAAANGGNAGYQRAYVYNCGLSAAQVLARYENGGPLAADYCNATGTSLVTGDDSTFASDTAFWTKGVGTTISGGKANFTSDSILNRASLLVPGRRYRATFTVSGYTSGAANMNNGAFVVYQSVTANGTYTVEFTAQSSGTLQFSTGTGVSWALDDLTIVPLGLSFGPEAAAPGVGPQWRDASGNGRHVNLPADGAASTFWALPGAPACDFGETRTASGFCLGRDAVHIPAGYRIARIWVSGNGTFSIGNAASGTEIVNAFTATATTQPATLAAYVTTSRKLYITLGTATTVTYTVHLERI